MIIKIKKKLPEKTIIIAETTVVKDNKPSDIDIIRYRFPPTEIIEMPRYNVFSLVYENNGIPEGFEELFNNPESKLAIQTIDKVLRDDGYINYTEKLYPPPIDKNKFIRPDEKPKISCYPHLHEIFAAYHALPVVEKEIEGKLKKVPLIKVVILGQDPYFTLDGDEPTAMGMCFSNKETHPISPSLKNIFKRLSETVEGFKAPVHGDLTYWANQGVFLLNTALTVPDKPEYVKQNPGEKNEGALIGVWSPWLMATLKFISETNPYCIYLLWGKPAQMYAKFLPTTAIPLMALHPSPQNNARKTADAFLKCNHFIEANEQLIKWGMKPIDWHLNKIVDDNGVWVDKK